VIWWKCGLGDSGATSRSNDRAGMAESSRTPPFSFVCPNSESEAPSQELYTAAFYHSFMRYTLPYESPLEQAPTLTP